MPRRHVEGTWQKTRAFSPAVATEGGTTIWVAGHGATQDDAGKSLAGDIDAQVHAVFAALAATLAEAGGKPSDMVTMTVFLTDPRNHRRFTELRREILGENFPASASIAISHLANPNALIEIQAVAVIG